MKRSDFLKALAALPFVGLAFDALKVEETAEEADEWGLDEILEGWGLDDLGDVEWTMAPRAEIATLKIDGVDWPLSEIYFRPPEVVVMEDVDDELEHVRDLDGMIAELRALCDPEDFEHLVQRRQRAKRRADKLAALLPPKPDTPI